jgi:hypothetical protein
MHSGAKYVLCTLQHQNGHHFPRTWVPEACGLCASRDLYETVLRGQVLQHKHISLQLGTRVEGIMCNEHSGQLTGANVCAALRPVGCVTLRSDGA